MCIRDRYVDNAGSSLYSIVEVATADRLGLLYDLTRALHDLALNIHLAKVDTVGSQVVDAFYVADDNGERVTDAETIAHIEQALLEAADSPPTTIDPADQ